MFKFGKKVSYRPILISFYYALIPIIALGVTNDLGLGLLIGLAVFSIVLFGYYLPSLPVTFNYWEADQDIIKYNDMTSISHRLSMIFLPFKNQLITINKKDIQSITVTGKLVKPEQVTYAAQYSAFYAVLTPVLSMIKKPVTLVLTMNDGKTIELSIARDYVYGSKKTLEKLDQFFDSLDNTQIKINYHNNHNVSLS
ncbi:hypothetical protein [Companilactobacillus kimchiensis]|uniref:Uncharacterized protein n=1 Tax=Companilactobacillus kimchiensis TaxID=993692 RepID=A0A0R2LDR7_9LACO|nr:hypothetical protein [Companilactobacillus kimchiensis]KRO00014.1 hypothetical protein IV57_GL002028 [Companilactobacillus kimchiensis]